MTEKTKITGEVMAFSNPFSHQPSLHDIIMVKPDKCHHDGLVCVPVKDSKEYAIHQRLEITITVKSKERVRDA